MASPRTWNKTVSASDTVTNNIVGGTAAPFGPSTIYVFNSDASNPAFVVITNMGAINAAIDATATDDGVSWRVHAGKEVAFNIGSPNSTEKYNVSVICAAGQTATVYLNAIQAQ